MKVVTINTGSNGNSYLLEVNNRFIILDCGITFNKITHNKDFPKFKDIDLVFVSHLH